MSETQSSPDSAAPQATELESLFPGYAIEGLIATGGMGAVYRAVQMSLDRKVAIKVLPGKYTRDASFRAIFESEAKVMARLNHPNLVGVYDFGEVAGMLYLVMEYVPGGSLFHTANGKAVDPGEVIRLICDICDGLAHAHGNGIVHRDIKPSNILLDLNCRPKIGDFGLARPVGKMIDDSGDIYGTPHYTAPEVIASPQSVDHRADIYSVGVMLHELLTGRLPADDPRAASAIVHCDPRFDAIIRRATDRNPAHRYSSATQIADELRTIATKPGPKLLQTAKPRSVANYARHLHAPKIREEKSHAPVIIILVMLVGVVSLMVVHLTNKPDAPPEQTVVQTTPSEAPEAPETPDPSPPPAAPDPPPPAPEVAQPRFDVDDFLDNRARKAIRDRAAPLITSRNRDLAENVASYRRALERLGSQGLNRSRLDHFSRIIDRHVTGCRDDGNHIPETLERSMLELEGAEEIRAGFFEKQQAIHDALEKEFSALAEIYLTGLENQITILRSEELLTAIQPIEEEIEKVRQDPGYFRGLMPGGRN